MLFQMAAILLKGDHGAVAGDYYFGSRKSVFTVAKRIAFGDFKLVPIKVTFAEGETVAEMSRVCASLLPKCDAKAFEADARAREGYLFPDTYFFSPVSSAEDVVLALSNMFVKKTKNLRDRISSSGNARSFDQIVIMASVIEKEAGSDAERGIISGILWKRIDHHIALGVDAAFAYILHKSSSELTLKDLKIDSPFNTYTHLGLPPSAIGNAGLASLSAALNPEPSPYWYYLHDKNGTIHYAKNFAEHKANKAKFLKN